MTEKQKGFYNSYLGAKHETIWSAYKNASTRKAFAFIECEHLKDEMNGYAARICSATCQFFTYAFKYMNENDGKEHLYYMTGRNNYDFAIK